MAHLFFPLLLGPCPAPFLCRQPNHTLFGLLSLAAMGIKTPFTQSARNEKPRRPAFEHRKTDEGYNSCGEDDDDNDQKHTFEEYDNERQNQYKSANDREIPIVRSTRTIRVSYTPFTYVLTTLIIGFYLHSLVTYPSVYLFPNLFTVTNLLFHLTHLVAHTAHFASLERLCVAYGTSIFWIGWILGVCVFHHNIPIDFTHPTTILFWILMLERRNAWGIIMWEHLNHLDEDDGADVESGQGASVPGPSRVLAYRVWCLAGVGCMWGLIYLAVANYDGRPLVEMLRVIPIVKICILNIMAGLVLIFWWSFWTFEYRGVMWRKELKEGVVVWCSSEGYVRAGEVQ
ncbi:hypothetical protein BC937DRAFT_90168 [Endogone sp. FLAS-F59071]|nr:hypothetical protein BC937DRAFT_90168 [Endogone sp. FLAS-F59071]|eukprot:RUS17279.1 hypothetical protein BC937DRAFT_90168 [Endogone sp. FLAS-F59071]